MDCNSSSECDLLLQVLLSLSDSKDVPDLLKLEGGRQKSEPQEQLGDVETENHAEAYLSKVAPGTLLDTGCTCPTVSFLPGGNPIGMEEEECKERPGGGTSLNEESGNQNRGFMSFHRGQ